MKDLLICEPKFDLKQNLYENNHQRIRTIKKKATLNRFFKIMQIDENFYNKYSFFTFVFANFDAAELNFFFHNSNDESNSAILKNLKI